MSCNAEDLLKILDQTTTPTTQLKIITNKMLLRACTCWFLILLSYLLQCAFGLVDTEIVPTNAKYLMRWKQFEMGIGGTAKISVDYNPNVRLPLRVYVCSPEEIKVLLDVYQR